MPPEHARPDVEHLASDLKAALGSEAVQEKQPLARYTSLRIGGPADLLVTVKSAGALRQAVTLAWEHDVPCRVLGAGSNVLVSDGGVQGLVVLNRARAITFAPGHGSGRSTESGPGERTEQVRAESGASFSTLARQCVARGLAGLEWAAGIPGTVGGAIVGNAGAWGGDVASTLSQAAVLEPNGTVARWPVEKFQYGYRSAS